MTLSLASATAPIGNDYINDHLIEEIWRDLGGQVSQAHIVQVAREVETEYFDATVTMFVPIFIHRETRERLLQEIQERKQ